MAKIKLNTAAEVAKVARSKSKSKSDPKKIAEFLRTPAGEKLAKTSLGSFLARKSKDD